MSKAQAKSQAKAQPKSLAKAKQPAAKQRRKEAQLTPFEAFDADLVRKNCIIFDTT